MAAALDKVAFERLSLRHGIKIVQGEERTDGANVVTAEDGGGGVGEHRYDRW